MPGNDSGFADWLLESMSSGVLAIDAEGIVVMLNSAAERMLQVSGAAWEGVDCKELLAGQPLVAQLLLGALSGRNPLSRAELVLEGRDGMPKSTIGFTLSPVMDGTGAPRGAAMIFRDLTLFERKEEQFRLQDRLAALGQMAAGLAHEIRNPLAGMEVLAGLLKRRLVDDTKGRELVTELIEELRAVAATVTQSLDFVKPVPPARAPIDLVNLLEASLGQALSRHPFGGVIERCFAADSVRLVADAQQMQVVMTNLILNAFEAMAGIESPRLWLGFETHVAKRAGVSVRLRAGEVVDAGRPGVATFVTDTTRTDPLGVGESAGVASTESLEVVISVADNGPGVPDEIREKVFYPFFSTKEIGSGIGLATAQKIVLSHGGTIEVAGRSGEGCTFRVHLPAGSDLAASADGVML